MRPIIMFAAMALAGFVVMIIAACDYIANVGPYDTVAFIAGAVVTAVGYYMTVKTMRAESERSDASAERRFPLPVPRSRQHAPVERPHTSAGPD
ncbi:MAG: hypothetical protein J5485_04365 [Candidatus Methanomethylophilaceae archaeon]|nr:hypothetical protein [Candidatus Methanomethylophilaceae archaeon]